jgi:raffinose/stachyose/melibiose transport system substrate-binding protein
MGDITLTVWDQQVRGGQDQSIKKLNAAFEAEYPNVTIKRVSRSFEDLRRTLRLAITGDDAPDVVQANNAPSRHGGLRPGGTAPAARRLHRGLRLGGPLSGERASAGFL